MLFVLLMLKKKFIFLFSAYVISSDGWEQLGLYEFFKAKAQARKQKGLPHDERDFNPADDFSPSHTFTEKNEETKRRRYREFKR